MIITSANVANAITKLVAADALPALLGMLVPGNLITRNFEPVIGQAGEGNLTTHAEATFQVPDITKILAVPDLLRLYMEPAIAALAEKIDGDIMALAGWAKPSDPSRWGTGQVYRVVSGQVYSQMRQGPRFSEYNTAGEAGVRAMIDGPCGRDGDVFVFRSQHVGPVDGKHRNLEFTKPAICMDMRRLPAPMPGSGHLCEYAELGNFGIRVTMDYRPNTLAQQFTIDILYGVRLTGSGYAALVIQ